MTMLQVHADALSSANTAYHEFLLRYKASANIVYGIVEGKEDSMFYRGLIEKEVAGGVGCRVGCCRLQRQRTSCGGSFRLDSFFAKADMFFC